MLTNKECQSRLPLLRSAARKESPRRGSPASQGKFALGMQAVDLIAARVCEACTVFPFTSVELTQPCDKPPRPGVMATAESCDPGVAATSLRACGLEGLIGVDGIRFALPSPPIDPPPLPSSISYRLSRSSMFIFGAFYSKEENKQTHGKKKQTIADYRIRKTRATILDP